VTVIRQGEKKVLRVTIGKLEEDEVVAKVANEAEEKLGLAVQELTPEVARSLGLKEQEGVLISNVEAGSAAAEAGLRRGEVIVEVNQQPVKNLEQYAAIMESALAEGSVLLLVRRGTQSRFVAIRLR